MEKDKAEHYKHKFETEASGIETTTKLDKATPRPWKVVKGTDDSKIIVNSKRTIVLNSSERSGCFYNALENESDYELIVRAVNSHEALVEACEKWLDIERDSHFELDGHEESSCNYCLTEKALKLAKGE